MTNAEVMNRTRAAQAAMTRHQYDEAYTQLDSIPKGLSPTVDSILIKMRLLIMEHENNHQSKPAEAV